MEKSEQKQWLFLILMFVTITALTMTTVALLRNAKLIGEDPLSYGMQQHNFTTCSCFDADGKTWTWNGSLFTTQRQLDFGLDFDKIKNGTS